MGFAGSSIVHSLSLTITKALMSVTLSVTWDSVSLLFHPKIRYPHDGSNVLNVVSAIRKLKLATGDFGKESCKASSQLDGTLR